MRNLLESHYVNKYGSEKGYLFLLMQISVITAIIISIACIISKNNYYLLLEIFPLSLLIFSLKKFKVKFKQDFMTYCGIFFGFFIVSIIGPFVIKSIGSLNPFIVVRYLVFGLIALIVLFLIFRSFSLRKEVVGKVLLADKTSAVVQFDFDLLAGVKAGKHVVVNKGAKKDDKVIVSMKRNFWATKPEKIKSVIR